ncbi:MAG: DUF4190 domain-containing protein [Phycisphaerales bacterium]|nr:DUF4190 domain-containing protein [Phycisphaerales bacterium]
MTQYQANTRWMEIEDDLPPATSKLAVWSLVCSLVFCIPFLMPVLGILLGASALAMMTSSRGRLRGTGLATSGIAISFLVLAVHTYVTYYVVQAVTIPKEAMTAFVGDLRAGNFAAVRERLTADTSRLASDDELVELQQRLAIDYGSLRATTFDFEGRAMPYMFAGGQTSMQTWFGPGGSGKFPVALRLTFTSGELSAGLIMVPNRTGNANPPLLIDAVTIVEPSGDVWTFPFEKTPPGTADVLNNVSWSVVREPNELIESYERALRQAQDACMLEPENGYYLNTLGVAQYRVELYEEALATLEASNAINGGIPADTAFLAMVHHRLGNADKAQAELAHLRLEMNEPYQRNQSESQAFLVEAEALLATPPDQEDD